MAFHFSHLADGIKRLYLGLVDYGAVEACMFGKDEQLVFVIIPINIRALLYKVTCINGNM